MKFIPHNLILALVIASVTIGCVSQTERRSSVSSSKSVPGRQTDKNRDQPAFIYDVFVSEEKILTFQDETITEPDNLPERLFKAGATPRDEITLRPQGNVPRKFLLEIANVCGRKGFSLVTIKEAYKGISFVQERGKGIEKPPPTKPAKCIFPESKLRKKQLQ